MSAHQNLILYTDGGARGNPGPAALGYVINDEKGETLVEHGEYLGVMTNNQAEYHALLAGVRKARALGAKRLEVRMDSELIVKQMKGEYRVKDKELAKLYLQVHNELVHFSKVAFVHVRREKNTEADRMVNEALDRHLK